MPSTSETSAPFPPWISYLLEPAFVALEQARAEIITIGRQLQETPLEQLRGLKEGPPKMASQVEPHPEDQAWLAQERDKLVTIERKEVTDLRAQLVDVLGTVTVLRIELGDDVSDTGLDTLIARYKGYIKRGEEE